jgi:hypothetical protein
VIRGTPCGHRLLAGALPIVTRHDGRLVEVDERGVVRRIVTLPARL